MGSGCRRIVPSCLTTKGVSLQDTVGTLLFKTQRGPLIPSPSPDTGPVIGVVPFLLFCSVSSVIDTSRMFTHGPCPYSGSVHKRVKLECRRDVPLILMG